ncbi:hypothetical protein [Magnetospirillum sp. 15-1]|uniref:hypothetical protein n=1 Tax=Magnetospirillum sp. 15-1 TaxID=1979370 RepID=UPI000BBB84D8|nr:hypothetical protein [Magnetospirillum sp. 15-1]
MKYWFVIVGMAMALTACTGSEGRYLIAFPDGGEGYSIRTNSGAFQAGKVTEADVVRDYMISQRLCPAGYDTVTIHRLYPENPSLVLVDAVVKCRQAGKPS